jgi:hypothetical protein
MIHFAVDEDRSPLLSHYLQREWGRPLEGRIRQTTYTELFRSRSLPRGAWIFTSLDALSDPELQLVEHIQTAARDAGLPVFNPAREALHRFQLLQLLHQRGENDFRAHRADGPLNNIRFPVFVRETNQHDGSLTPLLHDRAALRRAMAYLWLRGIPRSELLVVEFCDTASAEGLYRKYSVFRIGDIYVPRYLEVGRHWMTKSHTSDVADSLIDEEMTYLRDNPHAAWVREVFELSRIEYGRIDYGVRNGRPQLWEINFTPVLSGNPLRSKGTPEEERIALLARPAKAFAHAGIREAFLRIDPGPLPGGDVRVELPADLEKEARGARAKIEAMKRRRRWIDRIAAAGAGKLGPLLRRTFGG